MKILVINTGSSSIKFSVFDIENNCQIFESKIDKYTDIKIAIKGIIHTLESKGFDNFNAIGHRVVHGGSEFFGPVLVDDQILVKLQKLIPLAPLHQSSNLEAIEIFGNLYPNIPQNACFDTAFHHTLSDLEKTFALPNKYTKEGIVRYGFHGLSYQHIASELPQYAGKKANGKVIVAHLGNGASMCAMKNLQSTATTMSFTALDGLVMGTRCGNIDPGIILYLLEEKNMTVQEVSNLLYKESGLKGVSGISSDMRDLLASDKESAKKAVDLFCYQAAKQLSSLIPIIGGLDILVFTAEIGENSAIIRRKICDYLMWLGVEIVDDVNQGKISTKRSKVEVYVIPADEEKIIAQQTYQKIKGKNER
ncbi:MAG: acetate kinase [Lentimonas sp.]|jgi:acetate kinase